MEEETYEYGCGILSSHRSYTRLQYSTGQQREREMFSDDSHQLQSLLLLLSNKSRQSFLVGGLEERKEKATKRREEEGRWLLVYVYTQAKRQGSKANTQRSQIPRARHSTRENKRTGWLLHGFLALSLLRFWIASLIFLPSLFLLLLPPCVVATRAAVVARRGDQGSKKRNYANFTIDKAKTRRKKRLTKKI